MSIDKVLMNPPFDGSLHLEITEATISAVRASNKDAEIVSIQPARWIEDPLAELKQGTDYKKYKAGIVDKISKLKLIDANTACVAFDIMNGTDLGIYTFKADSTTTMLDISKQEKLTTKLISAIKTMQTLATYLEQNCVDGYRCEVKKITAGTGGHNIGDYDSSKLADVNIVWGPYINGYTKDGKFFSDDRQKNQFSKPYFANSIAFKTYEEAENFYLSTVNNFFRNLIQLLKWDVNSPLRFLPYMEDYSHVWTDKDYCKFFDLTEEEAAFMCRKVDDYRVKDFINYIDLKDED